jgi:cell division protein FtsL
MAAAAITSPHAASGVRTATPARTAVKPRAKTVARPVSRAKSREIYFVQEIDNSRVRRQFDPREWRTVLLYLAVTVVVCGAFLAFTWQQFAILRDGYTISELQDKRDKLIEANRTLESQVASLRTPDRITRYAVNNLGLVPPKEGQVVRLENPLPAGTESEPVMARLRVPARR